MTTTLQKPIIRLVTCGSVDDGKSTLIGRLLVETDSVPHDTVAGAKTIRRSGSTIPAGEIDFSLLTDGLEAEREQGITIDVAYRSMSLLNGRRLIIADAPGHEQYTRNMAVAASRADVALVLVDASRGIRTQTLRHLTICSLLKVQRVAVVVNKLDAVSYDESVYQAICDELSEVATRLGITNYQAVPVSALAGDNVVYESQNMPWYTGQTLLDYIQDWAEPQKTDNKPHMGIQLISRAENFRGLSGTVFNGNFTVGDDVLVLPSKRQAKISAIQTFNGSMHQAQENSAVTLVLEPEVDATRGDSIELAANFTEPADRFAATIVWFSENELIHSRSYLLTNGSTTVPAIVTQVKDKINVNTGDLEAATNLKLNEIGHVEVATDAPITLASYADDRNTGNFILIDRATMATVGAGMVRHAMRRATNITKHNFEIDQNARALQKAQKPRVLWLTGLSGSGKSTIANELEKQLFTNGMHSYILDGDNLRLGLNKDLGFTREDRAENVRRVAEVAKLMADAGLIVVVALVSPFEVDREHAREVVGSEIFKEVWVKTSAEVCADRDPKGLYKKAAEGKLPNLTGVGQQYEEPLHADIILDGTDEVISNVQKLLELVR